MSPRAILCPRCRRVIGSEETVCSWCGTSRSAPWWRIIRWTGGSVAGDWVSNAIIALTVIYYLVSLLLSLRLGEGLGFLSPSQGSLLLLGATGTIPMSQGGGLPTLLSASYLHGGILHLVLNLLAFRQLAPWVVNEYGVCRMFVIYTLGGVAGYLLSCMAGVPLTIGASAAICALIGSLVYYGKSRGGVYGASVYREVSGWLVSLFIFGLLLPGINNWAHAGGILGGILAGWLLGYSERRAEGPLHRLLALLCAVATVASLGWALLGVLHL